MHFKLITAILFGHPTLCLVIEIQANDHQPSLSVAIINCHSPTFYLSGGLGGHLHPHRVVEPWPGSGCLHRLLHAHCYLQDTAVGVRMSHTLHSEKKKKKTHMRSCQSPRLTIIPSACLPDRTLSTRKAVHVVYAPLCFSLHSRPKYSLLGQVPGTDVYRPVEEYHQVHHITCSFN